MNPRARNILSTEEARRGVMLTLTSNVAQAYFQLLGLELQLEIAKETTASFTDTLKLFTQRYEGGVASKLDTSRAAAAQAAAAATVPEFERQIALQENLLSVLLGSNPQSIAHTAKLLDEIVPPEIPVGLPSALLERRPDVLASEQQVRAANAQVGVATANFFPQFGLTALLGQASTPLSRITAGSANVWSVAANFTGPIYEGGALRAQKRQSVAFWEQTKLQYEQTALNAFTDVSNALISRQKFEAIRAEQARSVAAYQEAVAVVFAALHGGESQLFRSARCSDPIISGADFPGANGDQSPPGCRATLPGARRRLESDGFRLAESDDHAGFNDRYGRAQDHSGRQPLS